MVLCRALLCTTLGWSELTRTDFLLTVTENHKIAHNGRKIRPVTPVLGPESLWEVAFQLPEQKRSGWVPSGAAFPCTERYAVLRASSSLPFLLDPFFSCGVSHGAVGALAAPRERGWGRGRYHPQRAAPCLGRSGMWIAAARLSPWHITPLNPEPRSPRGWGFGQARTVCFPRFFHGALFPGKALAGKLGGGKDEADLNPRSSYSWPKAVEAALSYISGAHCSCTTFRG